ncbi:MAG: VWA domain-containing protein [Myxococcota bacterium]|nr:VWA domain-containing protein [Myxococcota bacterium]MDW8361715.1 VWA domain-containing protein [Myxococcales bacterium]
MLRSAVTLVLASTFGCSGPATAQRTVVVAPPPTTTAWVGGAPVQTQIQVGSDGQTYVGIWIDAPSAAAAVARAPLALSLVVDTSGSMAGEKIENARLAVASLVEALADGDIVSLHAFSTGVVELVPPTVVGPHTRATLLAAAQGLYAVGSTNMYGGLQAGMQRLTATPPSHAIRRLVLVSDGLANVGPSDPASFAMLGAQGTEWGIQITAIGVGLDYSEATLGALARASSGRLHHLTHPSQMAAILQQEVALLAQAVAIDGVIEIVPAPGVRFLEMLQGGGTIHGGRIRVPVGVLHAGQQRELLARVQLDASRVGRRPLAEVRWTYREPGSAPVPREQRVALDYEVSPGPVASRAGRVARVDAMVASFEAARAQLRAAELLNQGRASDAAHVLASAESALRARISQSAAPSPIRARLEAQARRMRSLATGAATAHSAPAAREAALESYDAAHEAMGY